MKQTAICKSKDQCHPQLTADGTQTRAAERSLFVFPALSSIVCAALEEMESISFPLCQPQRSSEGLVSGKASIFDGLWWLLCSQGEEEQTPVSALPASVQCSTEGSAPCPYVPECGPLPTKTLTPTHAELPPTPSIVVGCSKGALMGCRTTNLAANHSSPPHGHRAQGKSHRVL